MAKKEKKRETPPSEASEVLASVVSTDVPTNESEHHYWRRALPVMVWLGILVTLSVTLYLIPPEVIVAGIGVKNAYALLFVMSLVGGMMIFSGIPYHLVMVSFALSGFNPYLLGLVAGLGVAFGDSTSYYAGYFGRALLSGRVQQNLEKLERVRHTHPRMLPIIFFFYACFVPFSSDVFTIPMGLIRYPFWKIILPLACGSIIFNTAICLLAVHAYDYLVLIF